MRSEEEWEPAYGLRDVLAVRGRNGIQRFNHTASLSIER